MSVDFIVIQVYAADNVIVKHKKLRLKLKAMMLGRKEVWPKFVAIHVYTHIFYINSNYPSEIYKFAFSFCKVINFK